MGQRPGELDPRDPRSVVPGPRPATKQWVDTTAPARADASLEYDTHSAADEVDDPAIAIARAEIEQTRAEMSETIDALQERLRPEVLKEQAKETAQHVAQEKVEQAKGAIRQATLGRVEETVNAATDAAQSVASSAGDALSGMGQRVQQAVGGATTTGNALQPAGGTVAGAGQGVLDTIRRHPLPAAMIAVGAGWLILSTQQDGTTSHNGGTISGAQYPGAIGTTYQPNASYQNAADYQDAGAYQGDTPYRSGGYQSGYRTGADYRGYERGRARDGSMKESATSVATSVGQIAGKARESAGCVTGQATARARQTGGALQRLLQENPLAVGIAVAGVGMVAGLLVPETEQENQLLGGARDALIDRAGQAAQETAQRATNVAQEALGTAKQKAREQDLLPGS